ncbi:hypothetical protein [Roseibium sp. LAB1]
MNQYSCLRIESKKLLQAEPKNAAIWPDAVFHAVLVLGAATKAFRQSPSDTLPFRRVFRAFANMETKPVFPDKLRQLKLWRLDAAGVFDLDQGQNFDKQF